MVVRKHRGNIGDLLTAMMLLVGMAAVLIAGIDCFGIMYRKEQAGQLTRRYLLRMETVGFLDASSKTELEEDLRDIGIEAVSLEGTTLQAAGYGNPIELKIRGKIDGEYDFEINRSSTAKY